MTDLIDKRDMTERNGSFNIDDVAVDLRPKVAEVIERVEALVKEMDECLLKLYETKADLVAILTTLCEQHEVTYNGEVME
jgi:hypothetical protein